MLNLRKLLALTVVFVLGFALQTARAQNVYGTITGTITDSSGAAIANAIIKAKERSILPPSRRRALSSFCY